MPEEIVPGDKAYRNKTLLLCVLMMLFGLVAVEWVIPISMERLRLLPVDRALQIIEIILVLIFLSVTPVGIYVANLGRRTLQHDCFPPPGLKVIRDTPLVRGNSARRRGHLLIATGFMLILIAFLGAGFSHQFITDRLAVLGFDRYLRLK